MCHFISICHDAQLTVLAQGSMMTEFGIYELAVGGGTLALSSMPVDPRHLVQWRADIVLSMTQTSEMPSRTVVQMPDAAFDWVQFPVADFGVPDSNQDWANVQATVLAKLDAHGRVLVHCKGGCGRSGMAVLRLMIAAGEDPGQALARLRSVRPCAIETKAQLAWASGASLPWPL